MSRIDDDEHFKFDGLIHNIKSTNRITLLFKESESGSSTQTVATLVFIYSNLDSAEEIFFRNCNSIRTPACGVKAFRSS